MPISYDDSGIVDPFYVWPPDNEKGWGKIVYWQSPNEFMKAGGIIIADILRSEKAERGWNYANTKFNKRQKDMQNYNRRTTIRPSEAGEIFEAISFLYNKHVAGGSPTSTRAEVAVELAAHDRLGKDIEAALDEFSEFGGGEPAPVDIPDDSPGQPGPDDKQMGLDDVGW
ncbi:hypothetical protein CCP2SC5_880017 [Azospirillaceae bacterium]